MFAWLALKQRRVVPGLFEFVWDLGQVWSSWQETTDVGGASEEATEAAVTSVVGLEYVFENAQGARSGDDRTDGEDDGGTPSQRTGQRDGCAHDGQCSGEGQESCDGQEIDSDNGSEPAQCPSSGPSGRCGEACKQSGEDEQEEYNHHGYEAGQSYDEGQASESERTDQRDHGDSESVCSTVPG